jgi:hypothetical protein
MTRAEVAGVVRRTLGEIAPEADLASIEADVALRDQLDLDSMDMLNFAIGPTPRSGSTFPSPTTRSSRRSRGPSTTCWLPPGAQAEPPPADEEDAWGLAARPGRACPKAVEDFAHCRADVARRRAGSHVARMQSLYVEKGAT